VEWLCIDDLYLLLNFTSLVIVSTMSDEESTRGSNSGNRNNLNLRDMLHQANAGIRIGDNVQELDQDDSVEEVPESTRVDADGDVRLESPRHLPRARDRSHQDEPEDNPRVRRCRYSFSPINTNCENSARIFNSCQQVDLNTLERGQELYMDPRGIDVNQMLLFGQLLWIVTPGREENSSTFSYYKRSKQQKSSGCSYNRILFFRFCSEKTTDQADRIFCVVLSSRTNMFFFHRFPNARDNGICSIGSFIAIVNPDPIEDYMSGIPMITSNEQSILVSPPIAQMPVPMRDDLGANESKGFAITNSRISVGRTVFLDTLCSGKFCDRQNLENTIGNGRSCGCYSLKSGRNKIVSVHSLCFTDGNGEMKMMTKFSSLKFMEMFSKGNISKDFRASKLQFGNVVYRDIIGALKDIINLVNNDGGWTVYGWGKRGVINDHSMLGNETTNNDQVDHKVLSQEVTTHVVHIRPTRSDFLDQSTSRGRSLNNYRFDFSQM
jgi:hypothetical protein